MSFGFTPVVRTRLAQPGHSPNWRLLFCGSVRRICSFIDIAGDTPGTGFWLAEALMGAGIWLHVTEKHTHQDTHVPMTHANKQTHDEHYQHKHDFPWG
ncbi:hypothetical protein ACFQAT_13505 [Undibacterium arcticum]|uniref:hypothetical protein n=1 Tax=Undibacterium arcticum TaxID=1762892 RepID=UPI00361E514E